MKIQPSTIAYSLLGILLITTGIFFLQLTQKNPNMADTIGYVIAGKGLAQNSGLSFMDTMNEIAGPYFAPFAFQIRHDGTQNLFLGFPPGFPILLAVSLLLTGHTNAVFYTVPTLAILGLLLTFLLGKTLSKNIWVGLLAAIFVAIAPLFWHFGLDVWADIPSMVFVLAGTFFYVISRQKHKNASLLFFLSILAGFLLVYALYIRYANITFLFAIGLTELLTARTKLWHEKWRWPFFLILGTGLFSILVFNHFYYGGVTLSSYSPENGWYIFPPFSFSYAFGPSSVNDRSFAAAMTTLWQNFPLVIILAPLGWLSMKRPYGLLVAFCILFSVGLYTIYAFAAEGENGRFLLPVVPFIAISISTAILYLLNKIPSRSLKIAIGIGIILIISALILPDNINNAQKRLETSQISKDYVENWTQHTPDDMVLISYVMNDHIIYYGKRSVLNHRRIPFYDPDQDKIRYDIYEPCIVYLIDTLLANDIPVGYVKDSAQPLYDSFNVLQANYQLALIMEEPQLYQVNWQNNAVVRGEKTACIPEYND